LKLFRSKRRFLVKILKESRFLIVLICFTLLNVYFSQDYGRDYGRSPSAGAEKKRKTQGEREQGSSSEWHCSKCGSSNFGERPRCRNCNEPPGSPGMW